MSTGLTGASNQIDQFEHSRDSSVAHLFIEPFSFGKNVLASICLTFQLFRQRGKKHQTWSLKLQNTLENVHEPYKNEKVTAVSLCLRIEYCQSCQFSHFVAKMKDFVAKMKDFVAKMKDFVAKMKEFLLFLHLCQKSFVFATLFAMFALHTNEGSTYTEHV